MQLINKAITWVDRMWHRESDATTVSAPSHRPARDKQNTDTVTAIRLYYQDYYIPCLPPHLPPDDARAVIEQQILEMELPESVEREIMREIPQWLGLDREAAPVAE
ncbi:MAG: hypothetical protein C7B45_03515 [Sulfobacillus acidophilus]|uniref:Uncharacterized protein n=1 Tax=Sulfobacillus acidophilus TaxID=53633 RepID=A0A2T2WMC5_9FIRM|nr:MAG: hypothetical protein C7B45_03515 [Sulfobacillus acidophilus]